VNVNCFKITLQKSFVETVTGFLGQNSYEGHILLDNIYEIFFSD